MRDLTANDDCSVKLRDFYQNARDMRVPFDPTVFKPDGWTRAFAAGMQTQIDKGVWAGKHVLEIGVGSGINMAGLLTSPNAPSKFTAGDYEKAAVTASGLLIDNNNFSGRIHIAHSDLLQSLPQNRIKDVSYVVACIPQVPMNEEELAKFAANESNDARSHAYIPDGKHQQWDEFGLGLNARLLEETKERLPNAEVILNISGRPGIELAQRFFTAHGFTPEIIHTEIVSQHEGTNLSSLAKRESRLGHDFEFFKDREGTQRINAAQAEERRGTKPVFHAIRVIKGAPKLAA